MKISEKELRKYVFANSQEFDDIETIESTIVSVIAFLELKEIEVGE